MTIVFPSESDAVQLAAMLANGTVKLRLFTNNHTPVKGDTWSGASFTECTAAGYAAITLASGSWSIATVSGVTTATYAAQTFSFTASATIYGYVITQTIGGTTTILGAELAGSGPFSCVSGSTVTVTPNITAN
jgi:hypothetical protein